MTDCNSYVSSSFEIYKRSALAYLPYSYLILKGGSYLETSTEGCQKSDYNLNIPRYIDSFAEEAKIDLMAVRKGRLVLRKELDELTFKMEGDLEELGYGA